MSAGLRPRSLILALRWLSLIGIILALRSRLALSRVSLNQSHNRLADVRGNRDRTRGQKTAVGSSWEDCGRKRGDWDARRPLKSLGFFSDLLSGPQRV
jgi:hypothetical protein